MMTEKPKTVVVALGGNALGNTPTEQLSLIKETAAQLVDLIEGGNQVVVTHGNGPQVGAIKSAMDQSPAAAELPGGFPFPECGAMSQGYIGYHLQQALANEMRRRDIDRPCVSLVAQTVVNADDPAFEDPSKPIGPFFTEAEADKLAATTGNVYLEDSGRGYRWVVASPEPIRIVEAPLVRELLDIGTVVICSGGGGVPVIDDGTGLEGVPAVIDKDRSAALLAVEVDADILEILTAVDRVYLGYNSPEQTGIDTMTLNEAENGLEANEFGRGSMGPKVEACIQFVSQQPSGRAVIASLHEAKAAFEGQAGTSIIA